MPTENTKLAFVASKKVGNAIKRAKAKRKLRALFLKYENKVIKGKYIFVAKEKIFEKDYKTFEKDFVYAMKKLQLLKENEKNI